MSRQRYTEETKAQVMAALLAGQSVSEVAKAYNIPRGTIAVWSASKQKMLEQTDVNTKKDIGDLLLGYVRSSVITLKKQVEAFADAHWLKQQTASELAVLHGVIADKTIRLLEALADDQEEAAEC